MFHRNPLSCLTGPVSWQFAQNSKVYREFDLFLRFLPGEVFPYYRIYMYNCVYQVVEMGSVKSGEINYLAPVGCLFVVKFGFFFISCQ